MTFRSFIKSTLRGAAKRVGLDVIRLSDSPEHHWLGISSWPIATVIDIGANRGQFAREARAQFPQAVIHCFEPLPAAFGELERWASSDGNVRCYNLALGEHQGQVTFNQHLEADASSSLLETTELCAELYATTRQQTQLTVPLTTLDDALGGVSLASELLVKMDVQGYEDRVIRGGVQVLGQARACIAEVSLDQLYEEQATFDTVLQLFSGLDFAYVGNLSQVYGADGHVVYIDAVFARTGR